MTEIQIPITMYETQQYTQEYITKEYKGKITDIITPSHTTNDTNNIFSGIQVIETPQRQNQRSRILNMLKNSDFIPTAALIPFSHQYNARILELRRKGWIIRARKDDKGRCGFVPIGSSKKEVRNG